MLGVREEIPPGVHHWTAFQPELKERVSSYYVEPARETDRFAEAFRCLVRCPLAALKLLEDARTGEPFDDADEVGPGVTAIEIGKLAPDETALHVAAGEGAIAFGDALIRPPGGPLAFLPATELGAHPDRVRDGLRDSFRGLLLRDSTRCCSRTASRCPTTATPRCAASSSGRSASPATAIRRERRCGSST